jgi:metallo-beta-lactamase class B
VRYLIAPLLSLSFSTGQAGAPEVVLHHLTGSIYVVEDSHYAKTNSVVYIGSASVTVVGATWSPETAELLAKEIKKVTNKPIRDVILPDYNPEYAGGNAYWKGIGAEIISTELTYSLLKSDWDKVGDFVRKGYVSYPCLPLVLPTKTYPGDFGLENGDIRALYLGPSHTPDDIFVYFPKEKVLYAGSILKEHLGNLDFADLAEYPKTLHKLQQLHLNIDTIISGHWSAVHGPELIDQYLELLTAHSEKGQ